MNILFLCTANENRSKTAETYFRHAAPEHVYQSAGLSEKYCSKCQTTLCTTELLEWADRIFVMQSSHIQRISHYAGPEYLSKVTNLNIPDVYKYGDEKLILLLEERLSNLIYPKNVG
jgi:predicted protein tyrosine phosphatase